MSNGSGSLSQAEIDALINSDDDNNEEQHLTDEEKDIIGEIGNIAMGSSATALYTLLNKKVDITAPLVEISTFKKVVDEYTKPFLLIKVDYIRGLEGLNLLILKLKDAAIIADLMMGGEGTVEEPVEAIDEIQLSAVGEAMNQMVGSSSTSISNIIDEIVDISPPEPTINIDKEKFEDEHFEEDEPLVVTSFKLQVGDLIDSTFKQISPIDFSKKLIRSIQENNDGLVAKGAESEETIDATPDVKEEPTPTKEVNSAPQPKPKVKQQPSGNTAVQQNVNAQAAEFPEFGENVQESLPQNMDLLMDVPLTVTVKLGKTQMTISDVLNLGEGSIIELDKLAGELVDLFINGKLIAKGEVVVIDENFGFRVKDIISPAERLSDLK
jgi:flagellar motor switch protein FliN/FliY